MYSNENQNINTNKIKPKMKPFLLFKKDQIVQINGNFQKHKNKNFIKTNLQMNTTNV